MLNCKCPCGEKLVAMCSYFTVAHIPCVNLERRVTGNTSDGSVVLSGNRVPRGLVVCLFNSNQRSG